MSFLGENNGMVRKVLLVGSYFSSVAVEGDQG